MGFQDLRICGEVNAKVTKPMGGLVGSKGLVQELREGLGIDNNPFNHRTLYYQRTNGRS